MLIPLTELIRRGASDPPTQRMIGVDPEQIKLVEPTPYTVFGFTGNSCLIYMHDSDKPRLIADTPENVILATRGIDAMARRMMENG